mmetsp:Transcript_79605/g.234104  ORF Transcript_79605/g.234104 Transcript_79605/m.234104 type:complete len:219 (-) Transcript_79605:2-658(-)
MPGSLSALLHGPPVDRAVPHGTCRTPQQSPARRACTSADHSGPHAPQRPCSPGLPGAATGPRPGAVATALAPHSPSLRQSAAAPRSRPSRREPSWLRRRAATCPARPRPLEGPRRSRPRRRACLGRPAPRCGAARARGPPLGGKSERIAGAACPRQHPRPSAHQRPQLSRAAGGHRRGARHQSRVAEHLGRPPSGPAQDVQGPWILIPWGLGVTHALG